MIAPAKQAQEAKKPFHEAVAEKLIEQLKTGTAPWQKPWEPGESYLPMNPTTGNRYKGINAIQLMSQGRGDGRWMTYKQAASVGAQVRKGEKGTSIQYYKFNEEKDKLDEQGRPIRDAKGEIVKETVKLERPRVFFATVFNAEQIDGLPSLPPKREQTWNAVERAEHILRASGATITHAPGDRAFYRPSTDSITLPERGQFPSSDRYYATALHELGHWTGHPSRLDRDLTHPFGSAGYAKEELRAEIASMIVGDELGVGHNPGQHAAYVGSWIKALQDDPMEVFRAAADAEKIHGYVMALGHTKNIDRDAMAARIDEERIRNDPKSTREDISTAKEIRKETEMKAMLNDPDFQRRIAELERDRNSVIALHNEATKALGGNIQALQKNPALADRPVADLEKLAYWRGIVAEQAKGQPTAAETLARFDKKAVDPQFLKALESQETSVQKPTTEKTRERDTGYSL